VIGSAIMSHNRSALASMLSVLSLVTPLGLCGCAEHTFQGYTAPPAHFISSLVLASARDDVAKSAAATPVVAQLNVNADATQLLRADPLALQAVLANSPLADSYRDTIAGQFTARVPDWLLWGHLDGARVSISLSLPAGQPVDAVGAFAVRLAETTTVCLVNHSSQPLHIELRTRLLRGTYTVERLTLTPAGASVDGSNIGARSEVATIGSLPGQIPGNALPASEVKPTPTEPSPTFRLDRLQGQDLRQTASITKSGDLAPGQVVFYRYTEQNHVVEEAVAETYRQLALIATAHPGPAHRLRRMLNEGDAYRPGVRSGSLSSRLQCIQHLLLVVRQAQSLHHNYQSRGNVGAAAGGALMGSLERLMDGLSETSATLLDLVPDVAVEPAVRAGTIAKAANTRIDREVPTGTDDSIVNVGLANGGEHSVANVKLGLDSSELPSSVVCDPADPAFFGTLKPGQSVRATFHLRCPQGVTVSRRRCVADVCYRAGGGPAHLRPRPW